MIEIPGICNGTNTKQFTNTFANIHNIVREIFLGDMLCGLKIMSQKHGNFNNWHTIFDGFSFNRSLDQTKRETERNETHRLKLDKLSRSE